MIWFLDNVSSPFGYAHPFTYHPPTPLTNPPPPPLAPCGISKILAPRALLMRQSVLSFAPRVVMPTSNLGAAIVTGPAPISTSDEGAPPVEQAQPTAKVRRDPENYRKAEILNYERKHTAQETLNKFPEISESTLKRMKRKGKSIRDMVHQGLGKKDFKQCEALVAAMYDFFVAIGEACAHGAVSRALLEEWIASA